MMVYATEPRILDFLNFHPWTYVLLIFLDLPEIDAVVISHNHYDHLDYDSVCALNKRFGSKINWFVPKGQGEWMKQSGCNKVKELSWWDEGRLNKNDTPFVFACTPAQHWCRRGVLDKNKVCTQAPEVWPLKIVKFFQINERTCQTSLRC